MKEIIMEMEILRLRMQNYSDTEISFAKVLYAVTNKLNRSTIFEMTDEELVKHIQKIQILES